MARSRPRQSIVLWLMILACRSAGQDADEALSMRHYLRGEIVRESGRKITVRYDFANADQLKDFVEYRPPHLLGLGKASARVISGHLLLQGPIALRHRVVAHRRAAVRVTVKPQPRGLSYPECGLMFSVPDPCTQYVFLSLFDQRFKADGGVLLAKAFDRGKRDSFEWRHIASASMSA